MFALRFGTEEERMRRTSATRALSRLCRDSAPLTAPPAVIFNMYDLESSGMVTRKDMKRIAVAFAVGACAFGIWQRRCGEGWVTLHSHLPLPHPPRDGGAEHRAGEVPEWWDLHVSADDSIRVRVKDMKPLLDTMVEAAMQEVRGAGEGLLSCTGGGGGGKAPSSPSLHLSGASGRLLAPSRAPTFALLPPRSLPRPPGPG